MLDFLPAVISAKRREKCAGFLKGDAVVVKLQELEIKPCLSLCLWQVEMDYGEKEEKFFHWVPKLCTSDLLKLLTSCHVIPSEKRALL